jgi:hypothetical protein
VVSVLPGDESKLAVAGASSGSGGIFLSSNGGASWSHDDTFPAGNVQSLIWISASEGGGWDCPCLLATAGPDFQSNNAGGLYEANDVFSSHSWTRVGNIFPAVVPAGARCGESSRGANDLAVAPDVPHRIYVATDCGVAVGTPRAGGPPSFQTVPGAPDQTVESLVALSGGRLIVGGPAIGVWTFDGVSRWSEATGPSSGGNGVGWVHAFAPDPRDAGACLPAAQHCRAYVVTELPDRVALSETTDGGASWHRINIAVARFGTSFSCGGIANVHAVEQHGRLALYAGDTCDTFSATVPLTQEPYTSLTTSDWVMLAEPHGDTWDLAFHASTGLPYILTSDGGVGISNDGSTFRAVGPPQGLDSLQVAELAGQIPVGDTTPDLYFTTWHDNIWSMLGTSTRPAGSLAPGEGYGLGMPRRPTAGMENLVTMTGCDGCANYSSRPRFPGEDLSAHFPPAWMNAEAGVSYPTFISPRRYIQGVDAMNTQTGVAGLQMTVDDGMHWRQIANEADVIQGLAQVAGPTSNPTFVQPYADAADGSKLKLLEIYSLSASAPPAPAGCAPSTPNCLVPAAMRGFGGLGVTPANTPSYAVYAVDPTDPNRISAPDVINQDVSQSTTGGDDWTAIPGLKQQVTNDGVYKFSSGGEPNVSVISICPDDDSRVLIGTHQGGAFFSFNGGVYWTHVDASDQIQYATSIFWSPGCGAAYMSTFGRGIFRIDMSVRTAALPQHPCAPPICRLEQLLGQRILKHHALPSAANGLVVTDGYITGIRSLKSVTTVAVTAGSAVTPYRQLPAGLRIVRTPTASPAPRVVTQGAFFLKRRLVRVLKGSRPLVLFPLAFGHPARGRRSARPRQRVTLSVAGSPTILGTAEVAVDAAKALTVDARLARPASSSLVLQLDGRAVSRYPKGAKGFQFVGKRPLQMLQLSRLLGTHRFDLVGRQRGRNIELASAIFVVPNADGPVDALSANPQTTALMLTCAPSALPNGSLAVRGDLSPGYRGAAITVTYAGPNGSVVDQVTTDDQGNFNDATLATAPGIWNIKASFAGDPLDLASASSPCATVVSAAPPPPPQPTTLTLQCPASASLKGTLAVSGALSPSVSGAAITIAFHSPNGSTVTDSVTADTAGGYTDSTAATSPGQWTIQASYGGDATDQPSASAPCTTMVS